ncbi:Endonuclease/exonuclease/phosphatase [Gloeopeniophorella convolvens]|nr:Endonuclease/exonuclease/phosphatase [Gloeopeniophorella convolvens]
MQSLHHHQNSISHYPSPPTNGGVAVNVLGQPIGVGQGSPGSASSQIITPHWQQQLLKCEMIRASRSPHHRARASAMASRTVTKSAIPITNPNKPPPDATPKESDGAENGASPNTSGELTTNGVNSNINHPSSTVAPVAEVPRPTATKPPENSWSSLDMGGVQIKNLPPTSGLFSFTFLINLYLNHNALTAVPAEIAKLRHLELLDLSGNNLQTLPSELGMLTKLKELYLFDNHIATIPPELGTLHQLQTLGIEGNPLEPSLKAIVQKEGTSALISFLRDSCPIPPPPPQRLLRDLLPPGERDALLEDPNVEVFSVLCYNILCELYATERLYGYTPSWALEWPYRRDLIMAEIDKHKADFMCLQEIQTAQYEEYFTPKLGSMGYDGVYYPKSRYKTMGEADRRLVDGCAIFFKKSKYQLVEQHPLEFSTVAMQRPDFKKTDDMFNRVLIRGDIALIGLFENIETGSRHVIANAHICWDPKYSDVKLVQVALLVDELEKVANNFSKYPPRPPSGDSSVKPPPTYSDGTKIPIIISGDCNSVPSSGVYEFLANGSLPGDHPDFLAHSYGRYTQDGLRHRLGMKSAYAGIGELPFTNFTPSFRGAIDYIWYSTSTLSATAVLNEVDRGYLAKAVGFPDAHNPSDHIPIYAEFRVKPPRDPQAARPPPVFPNPSHA